MFEESPRNPISVHGEEKMGKGENQKTNREKMLTGRKAWTCRLKQPT